MKFLPTSLLLAALAGSPIFLPAANAKEEEVLNFAEMSRRSDGTYDKSYQYAFGDWEKKAVQIQGKGLLVNLTGSKGGVGDNGGIDFGKLTKARITFIIGNRNLATSFIFTVVDRDGTDQSFDVTLENVPRGAVRTATVDLTKPSRENHPGRTPGLNTKKLETWQLTGNFQSEPIEILFTRITAVSD